MNPGGSRTSTTLLSRRHWIAAAAGVGASLNVSATSVTGRRLDPLSEAAGDPSLQKFLARLSSIVEQRDTPALLAFMAPIFRVGFDGGKGPLAFRYQWHPDNPDSAVWKVLERLFGLGGTFYTPTLFAIPYVYTKFPFDLDPFEYVVVTRDQAPLRAEPSADAPSIGALATEIVRVNPRLKSPVRLDLVPWLKVEASSNLQGYVASGDVYSPAGYRAFFEKLGGKWHWISLACAE